MRAYFEQRMGNLSEESSAVLDLSSESFFRLGAILDWVHENRDEVRAYSALIDEALQQQLKELQADYDKDKTSPDRCLPACQFDEHRPATFVLIHLQRLLVHEAKAYSFKPNDGFDFCHAVMAAAYGSLIALDKQWKGRVERLPASAQLARAYYREELDQLVDTLEKLKWP